MPGARGTARRAGRAARRSVLSVCSQQADEGDTLAIITVRACSPTNESRSTCARPRRASLPAPCRAHSARGAPPGAAADVRRAAQLPGRRRRALRRGGGTSVSLEPRKGTWRATLSSARMHSLSASRLLLISAPSSRVCLRARARPGLGAAPPAHAAPCRPCTAPAHTHDLCQPAVQTQAPFPEHVRAFVSMLMSSRTARSGNVAQHLLHGWRGPTPITYYIP